MPKFRKKPVVIEAVQWTGENVKEVMDFMRWRNAEHDKIRGLTIRTLEGTHHASPGDWIIQGVQGEFYPCKPDIFAATYEAALCAPSSPGDGWVMVPIVPRDEMVRAGDAVLAQSTWPDADDIWTAMIDARPLPTEGEGTNG